LKHPDAQFPPADFMEDPNLKAKGKALVQFYGCAGCHEISGLEDEGRIGTELTNEGSKPIERLDFALLTEDAWVKMPPMPFEYQGREAATRFFSALSNASALRDVPFRFVPTRANGQPALGTYRQDLVTGIWHGNGLLVLALSGAQIREIIRFEAATLARFGLPRTLA